MKNQWNMKLLLIVFGTIWTIAQKLVKGQEELEIRGREHTIQSTTLSRSAKYWGESWRLEETCCLSISCGRPSAKAGMKNSQRNKIITICVKKKKGGSGLTSISGCVNDSIQWFKEYIKKKKERLIKETNNNKKKNNKV